MKRQRDIRNPGCRHNRKKHSVMESDFSMGYVIVWCVSRSGHNFITNNIYSWLGDPERKERRYVNGEDAWPERLSTLVNWNAVNRSPDSLKIIIVRDLLNWFTSKVYRKCLHNDPKPEEIKNMRLDIQRWKNIVHCYVNDSQIIMDGAFKIYYDDFVMSEEYRRKLCLDMSCNYNEDFISIVTKEGGGSSFTGLSNRDQGHLMDVTNRYKKLEGLDHIVSLLFEDPEVLYLYMDNFDVHKKKNEFLERHMLKNTNWVNG